MSVSLMAMAMAQLCVRAVSLNAFQVQMRTTSAYGNARLKKIDTERIRRELDDRKIVIVTGFQGVNKYDDYTTPVSYTHLIIPEAQAEMVLDFQLHRAL